MNVSIECRGKIALIIEAIIVLLGIARQ